MFKTINMIADYQLIIQSQIWNKKKMKILQIQKCDLLNCFWLHMQKN